MGTEDEIVTDPEDSKDSSSDTEQPNYWINITKRGGFRRLHRFKGCRRRPGSCKQDYELISEVSPGDYHAYCKTCWPKGFTPKGEAKDASDSDSYST
eukprot:5139780-Karenia_brevis.AAC.1